MKRYLLSNNFPLWTKVLIKEILIRTPFLKLNRGFFSFPYKNYSHNNLIGKAIELNDSDNTYYSQYYEETTILTSNSVSITDKTHKTETYKGKKYPSFTDIKINYSDESILPISIQDTKDYNSEEGSLSIKINGNTNNYKNIQCNRFHHFI